MPRGPGAPPLFLADSMLGRLARYLRFLGFDTLYERQIADALLLARAQSEGRILLSRDTGIFETRAVASGAIGALLLHSSDTIEQLRQVAGELELGKYIGRLPSRCVDCNGPLEELARAQARQLVPPFVLATQIEISYCPCCNHCVWRGSHWDNVMARIPVLGVWPGDSAPRGLQA